MAEINSTIPKLDLSMLRKQRIQIDLGDGRDDHILEINTTDVNVVTRLSDGYSKLTELDRLTSQLGTVKDIEETDTDETVQDKLKSFADKLKEIDTKMREAIDYIFDTNVCEVCCPSGSMYDPIGGKLRYEHIIDALMTLYSDTLSDEMAKTRDRVKTHTAKYINR